MKIKKTIALLLSATLMLGAVPAYASESGETEIYDHVSVATGDPGDLVPWSDSGTGKIVLFAIYEPLFNFETTGGDLYGVLADDSKGEYGGYDHEDGSNVYTMYIKEGIYDSAGNPFTAHDVQFCTELYTENGTTSAWPQFDHTEAVDDYTIDWYYTEEINYVGGLRKAWSALYFTQAAYEASDDGLAFNACGTGPYVLTSYTAGTGCVLERRDDYWQAGAENLSRMSQANVQTINYEFISEDTQIVIALETGTVDAADSVSYSVLEPFKDGGEYSETFTVDSSGDNKNYAIVANCASEWANDINFRLAVFYAISSEDIMSALGEDTFSTAYYMGNTNYGDYYEEWESMDLGDYDYEFVSDLDIAQSYLDQTDYDGQTIRIVCESGSDRYADIAQVIQAMLGQIGINCSISQYDSATIDSILSDETAWDFDVRSQAGGSFVVDSLNTFYGSAGTFYSHYDYYDPDLKLDSLIQIARQNDTHTMENIQACLEEIINNAYQKTLFRMNRDVVYNSDVFSEIYQNFKGWLVPWGCSYVTE